jgi:hypothetical protein
MTVLSTLEHLLAIVVFWKVVLAKAILNVPMNASRYLECNSAGPRTM